MRKPPHYPKLDEALGALALQYGEVTYEQTIERIRQEAKARRISQTELAKVAALPSQSAMSNVFKGTVVSQFQISR